MNARARRIISRKLKAISNIANWAEPAIDAYLRIANSLSGKPSECNGDAGARHPDVMAVHWPKQQSPGWASAWLAPIAESLSRRYPFERRSIPQPYKDLLIFEVESAEETLKIAVDTTDYVSRIEAGCLSEVDVYFKLQFKNSGYGNDDVLPGGFVPRGARLYSYLPLLRSWSLDPSRKSFDVYGRFGPQFGFDVRSRAITILKQQNKFQFTGNINRVLYARYLWETARARVCVDLPGNGPLCFRLVEYLALGSCVIAYPHNARLPVPLEDGKHIIYCKEDMSDLVDLCEKYLLDEDERLRIGQNAAEYFDKNLDIAKLADYYIAEALKTRT